MSSYFIHFHPQTGRWPSSRHPLRPRCDALRPHPRCALSRCQRHETRRAGAAARCCRSASHGPPNEGCPEGHLKLMVKWWINWWISWWIMFEFTLYFQKVQVELIQFHLTLFRRRGNVSKQWMCSMCVCNIWIDVKLPFFFFPLLPF